MSASNPFDAARDLLDRGAYEQATTVLQPLAVAGEAEAQFLLGYMYYAGAYVSWDEARPWLDLAARQDHPDALFCLATTGYDEELETVRSGEAPISANAVSVLRRAAELGSVDAQRVLGIQLCLGEGFIPKDEVEGRYWYTRAAERGDLQSQMETGLMHLLGEGGPQDVRTGLRWLERAAAGSDAEGTARRALETLIDVYETGRHGVPIDSTRAAEMKERLADLEAKSRGAEGEAG